MTLLTINQAVDRLTMMPVFIYKLVDEGKLTAYKIGRSIKIEEGNLDDYLQSRMLKSKLKFKTIKS